MDDAAALLRAGAEFDRLRRRSARRAGGQRAAAGERFAAPDTDYVRGRRMFFLLNDAAACLSLLKKRRFGAALGGLRDLLSPRVCEALRRRGDPKPFRVYLKNALKRGRHA